MNLKLISLCLIILFISACGAKQAVKPGEPIVVPTTEEAAKLPEAVTPPIETKAEMRKAEKTVAEKKPDEQYIMLNFENADIETVVSTISDMLKINYILAPGVSGKITIQSHNKIPVSELFSTFQTVLEFNGFTAVKEGSFYRIVPIDTAKQQPVPIQMGKKTASPKDSSFVTHQIPLEYVKANDVANLVRNLMPKGTDIIVYEPSNMLIITALPSGIMKLLKLLEAIDIPSTERDSVKTFIYHVENGEAKKLGEVLKNLYGKKSGAATPTPAKPAQPTPTPAAAANRPRTPATPTPSSTGATIQADILSAELEGDVLIEAYDDINALIIKSSPRAYLVLLETLKKIDVQAKQVLIEVLIAEISLDDSTTLGLEWMLKGRSHINDQSFDFITGNAKNPNTFFETTGSGDTAATNLTKFVPVASGGLFANIIDPAQFNVLINAAASSGKAHVLASPHILALDNKEAKIEIAQEVPIATQITTGTVDSFNASNTTSQVQYKSAGVILTVTPHINEKKQVTLKISQEVSEPGIEYSIGSGKFQGFNTRKANTTGIVQDGHTLVIGGIINEKKGFTRSGVPLLSKIPLFGYLFGTTTDTASRTELIVMVTPHVVSNHEEADQLTEEYKNRIKEVKKKIDERNKQAEIHLHNPVEEEAKKD